VDDAANNRADASVTFENFSFRYQSQSEATLRDINLSIKTGEKVLIAGPSGSGKSTLGSCVNGLIPFSYDGAISGCVRVMGETGESIAGLSRLVGTVLQDTDGQFIGLTVGEDIAFAMENDCAAQADMFERTLAAAKSVEMDGYLTHSPQELSGGQKQRVSMAGVMVDHVSVLLFDEPLASLDPAAGRQAIRLIKDIQERTGITVIIIEHRIEEALYLEPDRVIVVYDGAITCDMRPDGLLRSDTLKKCGLREPLYVSALKYAGCALDGLPVSRFDMIGPGAVSDKITAFSRALPEPRAISKGREVLRLDNINFSYDRKRRTLKDINLTLREGEMVSLIGRNGAGKSTLSRLVCGFVKEDSGCVYYKGRSLANDTIKERAGLIGMVLQNPNEMISKNGIFDEAAMGLRSRGASEGDIKESVNATLAVCGLYPFRNWPVSALSYGQKKRLTIASILVLDPSVLILDEPTAGQDYRHYTEIMAFLESLNGSGVTIIMITHDMHLTLEYTTRSVVMADGEIIHDGSPVAALSDPEIIRRANLRETSLFSLAKRCLLPDPEGFVNKFISSERERRRA